MMFCQLSEYVNPRPMTGSGAPSVPRSVRCDVVDADRVNRWHRSRNTISPAGPMVSSDGGPSESRTSCSADAAVEPSAHHHGKMLQPGSRSRPPVHPAASRIFPMASPDRSPCQSSVLIVFCWKSCKESTRLTVTSRPSTSGEIGVSSMCPRKMVYVVVVVATLTSRVIRTGRAGFTFPNSGELALRGE
jgi:hypothetical protein